MAKKQELEQYGNWDSLKWSGIGLLWILAFVGYYLLAVPVLVKVIAWVVVLAVSVVTLITTEKGKSIVGFIKNASIELQKVVWPTRKEAGQIALIVILVVLLTGVILWGVDSLVIWCIGKLTLLK